MKKFFRLLSILLVVPVAACTLFTASASAATYDSDTSLSGYKGRIGIAGGAAVIQRGDTLLLAVGSSEGHAEDLSKLKVTWSADPSEVKLTDKGFSKGNDDWEADITFLKGGVTVPVYATVNGVTLESDFEVWADNNGLGYSNDNFGVWYRKSDTTGNFTVPFNRSYTFKITASSAPSLVAGSRSFKYVSTKKSGNDYFIKFQATGRVGDGCGFYLDTGKLPVAVATITTVPFKSDTTGTVSVMKNKNYQFMITSASRPYFAIGSSAFRFVSSSSSGNRYFFKAKAVGNPGQASGAYVNYSEKPVAVLKVA